MNTMQMYQIHLGNVLEHLNYKIMDATGTDKRFHPVESFYRQ